MDLNVQRTVLLGGKKEGGKGKGGGGGGELSSSRDRRQGRGVMWPRARHAHGRRPTADENRAFAGGMGARGGIWSSVT